MTIAHQRCPAPEKQPEDRLSRALDWAADPARDPDVTAAVVTGLLHDLATGSSPCESSNRPRGVLPATSRIQAEQENDPVS